MSEQEGGDLAEPREEDLAEKIPPEPLPDDVDEDAGEEEVPEGELMDTATAREDPTVDDTESDV